MVHTERPSMIELRRLHRSFGRTRAVDDVSFSVYQGQVFGYIGPNGAGKTTTMRILATLDLPTAGDAIVDGFSVVNDPDRVRRRLGFMPDYFGTYHNVNVREYLDFFARGYSLRGKQRMVALEHTMRFTGLDVLSEKPISGLSKGMKQRLCLGRAMIHDPGVLVLDEPAAGLDPRARIELREMIRKLSADGKTVLVSSHILTELAEMCDSVGIIEQGKLIAVGSVDEMRETAEHATGEDGQPAAGAVVQIRVLGGATEAAEFLSAREGVQEVRIDGELAVLSCDARRPLHAALLRELVERGFQVAEFAPRSKTLEDVFLHMTKGRVQ